MEFLALCATLLLVMTIGADVGWASSWTYEGDTGPPFWHELFPESCSGKHQSPINIDVEETMYNPDLRDFAIWYDPPQPDSEMTLLNNGHTVQVVTSGEFYVTNAGLPHVYKTAQFHFHWGSSKKHGSEHMVDGIAFPLEMHIVNYNSDLYDDIGAAVKEKEGLAVLGVLFEISEEDNEYLEPIIAAMGQVRNPEDGNQVEIEPLSLRRLLPKDITRYYRYNGSLTTPGCFETVIWTLFEQTQHISHRQMQMFREQLQMPLHAGGGHHKRSVRSASRSQRRRERRALQVLDELALNTEQRERFRRDLEEKKEHAEIVAVEIDEENAEETHLRTVEAVHVTIEEKVIDHGGHISEVEVELIQENLVNNFRPVQLLNDRLVYRSFKLRGSPPGCGCKDHSEHSETEGKRLQTYGSTGSASSNVISLLLLFSCLTALFM